MQIERCEQLQNREVVPELNRDGVFHFFGTRQMTGVESLLMEVKRPQAIIKVRQVHGDHICRVTSETLRRVSGAHLSRSSLLDEVLTGDPLIGDAIITNQEDVLVMVATADCAPLLLFDPVVRVVAAVHAGWRGTLLNIAAKVVYEMALHYGSDPKDIVAGIGPAIGPCCYEVGKEVWREMEREFPYGHETIARRQEGKTEDKAEGKAAGKAMLNLSWLNMLQLTEAGLRPEQIGVSGLCTSCNPDIFYSYRRDGRKLGTMQSGVMLTVL